MCKLENWLHKKVPEVIDLFVTPLVTVLVTGFLTMTFIGPVFAQLETWVLAGARWLISIPFGIGAFLMGAAYAPTVVAGVHHMYNAIELSMLAENGKNIWMPIATAANVAQGAAALAVAFKTKQKKLKSMALPASLSAFLGITEPAIFGVNLRFMKPLIAGMVGGAFGSAVASIMNVYATANGVTGIFGFLITTESFLGYLMTFAVSVAVAFGVSWLLWKDTEEEAQEEAPATAEVRETQPEPASAEDGEIIIASPLKGNAIPLADVPDPTFAEGILGLGAAVEPSEGRVVAPADAEVTNLFDTNHAIGLLFDNGVEILIHIGIDTVEMNGEGFRAYVTDGARVKKGDLLIEFDIDKIKEAGHPITTPVIVTNADDYSEVGHITTGGIDSLSSLIRVKA